MKMTWEKRFYVALRRGSLASSVASIALSMSNEPPKEILFFKAGWNETQKGKFLFDDQAARDVMAAYERHGVDCMIDLEHLSLDPEAENYDPDARAWYKLSVRDGALWATEVEWTPDGEDRLRNKKQRYISPFFEFDPKTKRIKAVFNAGLVAVPATNDTPALIAASLRARQKLGSLPNEAIDMNKILSALGLKDDATEEDALAAIKALTDGGGDSDEVMKKLRKALKLADDASADECMSALSEKLGDDEEPSDDDDKKEKEELKALAKLNPKLYGELMALRAGKSEVDKRIGKLEKLTEQQQVDAFIQANIAKIPLSMEKWAKGQSIEVLSGFVSTSQFTREPAKEPKHVQSGNNGGGATEDPDKLTEKDLTPEDLKTAKLAGIPPSAVLAERKRELQRKRDHVALSVSRIDS
jgi:phage I-like protein